MQVCPGYRCVLCGTVAKSRNSLHSHMSRQHRGISTKDLPVVPMPAPFDAELASRLLAKSGVKVRLTWATRITLIDYFLCSRRCPPTSWPPGPRRRRRAGATCPSSTPTSWRCRIRCEVASTSRWKLLCSFHYNFQYSTYSQMTKFGIKTRDIEKSEIPVCPGVPAAPLDTVVHRRRSPGRPDGRPLRQARFGRRRPRAP